MRSLLALSLVLAAAPLQGGCSRLMGFADGGSAAPLPHYPDGEAGLRQLWTDVLDAARKDERERVHALFATLIMSDDDLKQLFGAEAGAELASRYHVLMASMVNPGSLELVAQIYERKYDAIEVLPYQDANVTRALKTPLRLYSVRVKRAVDSKGLRYDFFFYRGGKWLTGNQLGKSLAK